jgi:hypothetical protein
MLYSTFTLIQAYNENKEMVDAYLSGKSIENYTDGSDSDGEDGAVLGMAVGIFSVILIISLALWIWALVLTISRWDTLPDWGKVLCIWGLIAPPGPLMTLIVAYVAKN